MTVRISSRRFFCAQKRPMLWKVVRVEQTAFNKSGWAEMNILNIKVSPNFMVTVYCSIERLTIDIFLNPVETIITEENSPNNDERQDLKLCSLCAQISLTVKNKLVILYDYNRPHAMQPRFQNLNNLGFSLRDLSNQLPLFATYWPCPARKCLRQAKSRQNENAFGEFIAPIMS